MKAPDTLQTDRLLLRRPRADDAQAIFARYASDPEVTRLLSWPRHTSLADTHAFLSFSNAEWEQWPGGPYLIFSKADGALIGGTGLGFETPRRAVTGYVLARDAWRHGYATETLRMMVVLAPEIGVQRLYALCHHTHQPSSRVLEKCGFECEGLLRCHTEFPNLGAAGAQDVLCYARTY